MSLGVTHKLAERRQGLFVVLTYCRLLDERKQEETKTLSCLLPQGPR